MKFVYMQLMFACLDMFCMLSFQKTRDLGTSSGNYDYSRNLDSINTMSSSFTSEDSLPNAASEKELVGVDCVLL